MDAEINIIKDMNESVHLHPETELLFVIEGHMEVTVKSQTYLLDKEQFLIVNANQMHSVVSEEESLVYVLRLPWKFLKKITCCEDMLFDMQQLYDDMYKETEHYRCVKEILQQLVYTYVQPQKKTRCAEEGLLFNLMDILTEDYEYKDVSDSEGYSTEDERMDYVLGYIRKNFTTQINLAELAESMYISASTLSRLFKKQTGIYFVDYVNQMRVRYAAQQMLTSSESITKIAVECGFSNLSAFNKVFRKIYQMSPSEYKASMDRQQNDEYIRQQELKEGLRYKIARPENILKNDRYEQYKFSNEAKINIEADVHNAQSYKKNWNKAINMGSVSRMAMANLQFHAVYLKEHLNIEYIRIWNVFSKKLQISDGQQKDRFNYDDVDQIFDFLVANHIKVILDFGRRPDSALKAEGEMIFWQDDYTEFQSREAYESLLENFIFHLIKRYGKDVIEQWKFEFTYIEDHKFPYYQDVNYDYFNVFSFAYGVIKSKLPNVEIGCGGGNIQHEYAYLKTFLERCITNDCRPDFLSYILFPYFLDEHIQFKRTNNSNLEMESIYLMQELIEAAHIQGCKIYIVEWNSTVVNRNILNDSTYRAAYIALKTAQIWDKVDMLCLWMGSDWVSSYYDSSGIAYGGGGILTKDSICKPAYYVLDFLNMLGDELLVKNNCMIATKKGNAYYILYFNYKAFSSNYFLKEEDEITYDDMHRIFMDNQNLNVHMTLKNMPLNATYTIKRHCISEDEGSLLTEWEKFQFDTQLERSDVKYIKNACYPRIYMEKKETQGNRLSLDVNLKPHEIMLVHIYQND